MYLIVEFVTSENLKTSITLSLYIHTQANYTNKMKINTIQKKTKNAQAKFQRNIFALKKLLQRIIIL